MHYADRERIAKGIDWIVRYQPVERNTPNRWIGSGVLKYGGCMKSTPCYVGIVKSMIALTNYQLQAYYKYDARLATKLATGLEYILDHQLYQRKSSGAPITGDILKISYPFTWKTNVIEILRLLKVHHLHMDPRCNAAKENLLGKRKMVTGPLTAPICRKCGCCSTNPRLPGTG